MRVDRTYRDDYILYMSDFYFRNVGEAPMGERQTPQHVVPRNGQWAVRREGSTRDTKRFETQEAAIRTARRIARNQGGELVVHGRDGRIRKRSSYGSDPYPPRG